MTLYEAKQIYNDNVVLANQEPLVPEKLSGVQFISNKRILVKWEKKSSTFIKTAFVIPAFFLS